MVNHKQCHKPPIWIDGSESPPDMENVGMVYYYCFAKIKHQNLYTSYIPLDSIVPIEMVLCNPPMYETCRLFGFYRGNQAS